MNVLRFNTKEHTMTVVFSDGSGPSETKENVMTIKDYNGYYEVLQRQSNEKNAPIYRFPINNTMIVYIHE